jgi:hypothetical protein
VTVSEELEFCLVIAGPKWRGMNPQSQVAGVVEPPASSPKVESANPTLLMHKMLSTSRVLFFLENMSEHVFH